MKFCPDCGKNLALVGRVHRCIPQQPNNAGALAPEASHASRASLVKQIMTDLGTKGGKAKSPKKTASSRMNGKKGGRKKTKAA